VTGQDASSRRRAFIADTTALILFFTTTGIINERFIADMSWEQVLHARLLGAALMVPIGRPYASGAIGSRGARGPAACRNFSGTVSLSSASRRRSMPRSLQSAEHPDAGSCSACWVPSA
jgi:hypothetical protein